MASTGFPNDAELNRRFEKCVKFFWSTRARQTAEQQARGGRDQGARSAATGGKQMNLLEDFVAELVEHAGISAPEIFRQKKLELPGYFRPEKKWDLLVVSKGALVCALEFKSLIGPSFGNNANNRIEEALGSSNDVWLAYREGHLGKEKPRPFLGYLLLLENCSAVHKPVEASEPHFKIDPNYRFSGDLPKGRKRSRTAGASYSQRFQVSLRRLIAERFYDTACLTLASRTRPSVISFPAPDLDFRQFALSLSANAAKFAAILR
jgi:hypothetical protein